jgi:hypothetical protein
MMEVKVCECPVKICKYRWISRVPHPKECPNDKHRFDSAWGLKLKSWKVKITKTEDLKKLRKEIDDWNAKGRFA